MKSSEINDSDFRRAVEAIDAGNLPELRRLIKEHPRLLKERLATANEGYFKDPYLLYFVADNPIRIDRLPANIVEITADLVRQLQGMEVASCQMQLDYTLGLVTTGRIPRECGVQIELMDLLIDAGACPGGGLGALAHGNIAAANRLMERGGELTLGTAIGLERAADIDRLIKTASQGDQLVALTVAAFYGKAGWMEFLLARGAVPNGYPTPGGFHSHATPLHQAVYAGSLACVKLLVNAGANLTLEDKIYHGTPIGWAKYMLAEEANDEQARSRFNAIAEFLQDRSGS